MNEEFRLMPEQASTMAADVDRLYLFLWSISGAMTLLIGGFILYLAIKYRRGSAADRRETGSHFFAIEISWIVGPFIVTMIMFFWGARLYVTQSRPPAGALEITSVGRQWMWKFQHPDGRSEINELHVPLGQPIKVRMISEDVIHSLFIPAFRVKQDVLPGRYTTLWFEPTRLGVYHLFCAEYCGTKHSEMRGYVHVMEPAAFQAWLAGEGSASSATGTTSMLDQFRCNTCHQGGGVASRGPPLQGLFGSTVLLTTGATVVADENYLRESILRPRAKIVAGFQPLMPSFEGQLSEEGINQLIQEIKRLGRGDPRPAADSSHDAPSGPEQLPAEDAPAPQPADETKGSQR